MSTKYPKPNIFLIFTFIFILLSFSFLSAQDTWVQTYQPFGDEVDYFVEDIRVCPDEGYAVIGSIWNSEFSINDGFMMKTDSDGNFLWASIDTVDFVSQPEPSGFVVLDDGSFITAGNNFWFGGHYFLKRSPDGIIEWTVELDNDLGIEAIELTNEGNLITTAGSMDGSINLQKFDLEGNLIWRRNYLPYGFDYGSGLSVTQTLDTGYAITGGIHGSNNNDIIVIKTNENGDSLWTYTYDGYGYNDQGNCIIENNNEGFIIVGEIHGPINRSIDTFILNINTNGDTLWMEIIPDLACSYSVVKTQDNNFVGYCWSGSSTNKTRLYKFDELGCIIWNEQLPHWPAEGDRCFQELDNGGFICGGRAQWGDSIFLTKTNSDGIYTAIDEYELPLFISLSIKCYPNPFNPKTTISFSLSSGSKVELTVFNIKGQKVKTLVNEVLPAGEHSVVWDGKDNREIEVCSGVYFYMLKINGKARAVKKCLMLK